LGNGGQTAMPSYLTVLALKKAARCCLGKSKLETEQEKRKGVRFGKVPQIYYDERGTIG